MNVAIIGSNSFLAQYIIRELTTDKINIMLYGGSASVEFPESRFTVFKFPEHQIDYDSLLNFDTIIYTAGAGIQANLRETTEVIYELNSFLPIRLANILSTNGYKGKLLTFGSYFEIGSEENKRYYSENEIATSMNKVPNHYCTSKRLLSRYLSSCPLALNFYHLILPNIYGKGENSQRLIPYLINAMAHNGEIKLTSGEQVRQYIHVSDVAKTVLDIIKQSYPPGFYNLCSDEALQVKTLAQKIVDFCGKTNEYNSLNLFGSKERNDTSMRYLLLNNTKAVNIFKYQPKISIEEGIKTYLV